MSAKRDFVAELGRRVLVLDGATGTCIQARGLSEADFRGAEFADTALPQLGNNDLLVLTKPDAIRSVHDDYFAAGADIVETDTFNATPVSLADYGMAELAYRINREAARIACESRDAFEKLDGKPRFVAGSIGPTKKSLSVPPRLDDPAWREYSFDELASGYMEQIAGLVEGGVDLLLIETVYDSLVAKAALAAADEVLGDRDLPIALSFTVDRGGRTLAGQDARAFLASLSSPRVVSVGLNCSFGIDDMLPFLRPISEREHRFVSVYPNAGLPDALGRYAESPAMMAGKLAPLLAAGLVNIVGGCCGTTPAHIKAIAEVARAGKPRARRSKPTFPVYSGLEELRIEPGRTLVRIGERTSVTGSAAFRKRVAEDRWDEAVAIARKQVEAGADMIDVNMDDAMIDAPKAMETFLRLVNADPDVCRVPVMIDSSDWAVVERGLACVQGKCLVNSISLKNGEGEFLERARIARRHCAGVVVMAFDERGQASSFERRTEILGRSYRLLVERLDFDPRDIVFDPNVLTIGTGMEEHANFAVDFIRTVAWLKTNCPGALTSGGISNLSYAFRGNDPVREALHAVFLREARAAGLDMAIVNPSSPVDCASIEPRLLALAEDLVLNRRPEAAEELASYAAASGASGKRAPESAKVDDTLPVLPDARLERAIVRGDAATLDADLTATLDAGMAAIDIVAGPLMKGMDEVGRRFGAGAMFLPQVIKAARVMKRAVEILEPRLRGADERRASAGTIVLATVRGDVHDIGKNIFGVVLACNGFDVVDLGVMVEPEAIADAVIRRGADLVGLSALISPSLEEMRKTIAVLRERCVDAPVLIGGAAASELHTAVRLRPERPGRVFFAKDASEGASLAKRLVSAERGHVVSELERHYEELASRHVEAAAKAPLESYEQALLKPLRVDFSKRTRPTETGARVLRGLPLDEVARRVDWDQYLATWGLRRPASASGQAARAAAEEALADARRLLAHAIASGRFEIDAVYGIFRASSDGVAVEIDGRERVRFPRSQRAEEGAFPSLCDFIATESDGDHIGVFAAGVRLKGASCPACEGNAIEMELLADALADAASGYLHETALRESWPGAAGVRPAVGYPSDPNHLDKDVIWRLLEPEKNIGVTLTESRAMRPASSVCGFWFAHPDARYVNVTAIGDDQLALIAGAHGLDIAETRRFLGK